MVEARSDASATGRIRLGMVGGGQGAFIGAVHRIASRIDDQYDLVAGALSSTPKKAIESALEIGIPRERAYGSFEEMAKAEAKRPDGIEAVAIVTPNHMHAPVAKAFLKAGIHVICDKPLALSVAEAKQLVSAREEERQDLRAHPQLHRLSDDPAGARHGRRRRTRRHPAGAGGIRAGLADRAHRGDRPEAVGVAHRSEAGRGRRARRYRHPRLQSRPVRFRADAGVAAAPTSPCS